MWWRSTYSCRWSSPVWNPLLFNVFSRICVRLFPSSIVQNNHFPAFTNPWVPLPVSVLPHLLEWRPVGLRCLDRLLQLLIRPGKTWTKSPRQWQITKNHKFKPRQWEVTMNHSWDQDQDLQLLHQAWDLPQLHGRDSPGEGTAVDDGMQGRGAYLWEGEVLIFN